MEITEPMLEFQAGDKTSAGGRQEQPGFEYGGQSQNADHVLSQQALEQKI